MVGQPSLTFYYVARTLMHVHFRVSVNCGHVEINIHTQSCTHMCIRYTYAQCVHFVSVCVDIAQMCLFSDITRFCTSVYVHTYLTLTVCMHVSDVAYKHKNVCIVYCMCVLLVFLWNYFVSFSYLLRTRYLMQFKLIKAHNVCICVVNI